MSVNRRSLILFRKFKKLRFSRRKMSTSDDIANRRKDYKDEANVFLESSLHSKDPMKQFEHWFENACNTPTVLEPNAMTLSTVNGDGRPTSRMVLLKGFDENGFKFYTNYRSGKAKDLEKNPYASLVFYWVELSRSIRIEGAVEKLSALEADRYFAMRPKPSQVAAHVSANQSAPIDGRQSLKRRQHDLEEMYKSKMVPKPEYWGGYIVKPDVIEFWQGQKTRIHDRIRFYKKDAAEDEFLHKGENGWVYQRLEP